MKLFLMRHGEAELYATSDAERNLTETGIKECQIAGQWLKQNVNDIGFAMVSPYVRAQQSFEALSNVITVKAHQTIDDITPQGDATWVADYLDVLISENTKHKHMLVVTHMPLISQLLDNMIIKPAGVFFPTGGIAMIDIDESLGKGQLLAFG